MSEASDVGRFFLGHSVLCADRGVSGRQEIHIRDNCCMLNDGEDEELKIRVGVCPARPRGAAPGCSQGAALFGRKTEAHTSARSSLLLAPSV